MPDKSLLEEIERIYTPTHPHKYQGHPVHYKLSADNKNAALQLATCLCRNLYANQRLVSRCISYISDITERCYDSTDITSIFRQSAGGTIVIELTGSKEEHLNYTTCYEEVVNFFAEQIKNVLGDKTSFRPSNIYQMYDRLYRNNLRNNAYTAYKEVSRVTLAVRKHSAKDAYSRLQSMIGLHEVKKVIENILDTFRAQKIRSAIGLNQFRPNMHMVFTGNPGSAKNTVASVEPHPYI